MNDDNISLHATSDVAAAGTLEKEVPSVQKIIKFAIPAIGIWLCSPLLSLIDTSAVGLLSGTAQQAALNPAITITDDGALLASFMYTATINLVAAAFESDRGQSKKERTISIIITSIQLGSLTGIVLGTGLGGFASILLKYLVGKGKEISPDVMLPARKYVQIRAIGMPAAVAIGSAQSACLGMKDMRSPLYVMLAAAIVNLIGDVLFVPNTHPWIGGAAGAAWATVFSQYFALALFLRWLTSTKDTISLLHTKKGCSTSTTSPTARGILNGHIKVKDVLKAPLSIKIVKKFRQYFIPVTTASIGKVSGYIAMSHVVSNALSTTDMAAQQIILSFFLCFVPICDSLNLTAQSFIPGIFELKGTNFHIRAMVMKRTVTNFIKAGCIFGFTLVAIVACMPLACNYFTHDPLVIARVNSATPSLIIYFALSGIVCAGEGVLLGQKDLGFLSKSFTLFFIAVPYFLLRLKKATLEGVQGIGINSVWKVFSIYQIVRCSLWLLRMNQLLMRSDHTALKSNVDNPR